MRSFFSFCLAILSCHALGYDGFTTHTDFTSFAADRSVLGNPSLYEEWGLKGTVDTLNFTPTSGTSQIAIRQLLIRGVREEDSGGRQGLHFFDPTIAQGMNGMQYCSLPRNADSRTFGLEGLGQPEPNAFSYAAARKAMVAAFTESSKSVREQKFGLMFEALGHVIHFLQDLGQPQHVRNDVHLEFQLPQEMELTFIERRSRYEGWASEEAARAAFARFPVYGRVDKLKAPGDFWKKDGKGIAEYTNRNFVSQDSNFEARNGAIVANSNYSSPVPTGMITVPIENLWDPGVCPAPGVPSTKAFCFAQGSVDFVSNQVTDLYTEQVPETNARAAMYSIFNQDLQTTGRTVNILDFCPGATSKSADKLMTTNELTFPSAARFLIPRAIGYSAGMIDYFFRGKIDLYPHATDPGKLIFKNKGDEVLTGTVRLYYDGDDGFRHEIQGGNWLVTSLQPGALIELNKSEILPVLPFPPKQHGVYIMVFTGTMGEETAIGDGPGAVVAKQVKLPAPEFYWSYNQDGSFRLSFKLPNAAPNYLDYQIRDNLSAVRLKVNGSDQPLAPIQTFQDCAGEPLTYTSLGEQTMMYAADNKVLFWDEGVGRFNLVADAYEEVRWRTRVYSGGTQIGVGLPRSSIACGNSIWIGFPTGQTVGVELLLGTASLFKFCASVEVAPVPVGGTDADYNLNDRRLVMWGIQNARIVDRPVAIRQAPSTSSCPGQ